MKGKYEEFIYIYPVQPRDSKVYSDEGYIKIDDVSQGGTH